MGVLGAEVYMSAGMVEVYTCILVAGLYIFSEVYMCMVMAEVFMCAQVTKLHMYGMMSLVITEIYMRAGVALVFMYTKSARMSNHTWFPQRDLR